MAQRHSNQKKGANSLVEAWFRLENALLDTEEVEVPSSRNELIGGSISTSSRKQQQLSSPYVSARPQSSALNSKDFDLFDGDGFGSSANNTKKNSIHLKQQQKFTSPPQPPQNASLRPQTAIQFGGRRLLSAQSSSALSNIPDRKGLYSATVKNTNSKPGLLTKERMLSPPGSAASQVTSMKGLMNLRAQSRPFSRNGVENPHIAKLSDLQMLSQIPPQQIDELIQKSELIRSLPVDSILDLFNAKCRDMKVEYMPDQAVRFIEKLKRTCGKKVLNLRECGLSIESAHVLGEILVSNQHFSRIDLQRNCIADTGAAIVGEALRYNFNVIHLDISSNAISPEGFQILFESLSYNQSLISLDISSREGLNRNKLSIQGSEALSHFLAQSEIITILNISGTSPGEEGSLRILDGIAVNKSLASIDLSHNELGQAFVEYAVPKLCNSNLLNINISDNSLGDTGAEAFSQMTGLNSKFYKFENINLSNNGITSLGIGAFFDVLHRNLTIKKLILDGNHFTGNRFGSIQNMLWENSVLEVLSLKNCEIEFSGGEAIGVGLQRNTGLKELYLNSNKLKDVGSKEIAQGIKVSESLVIVDLSMCHISDDSGMLIAESIKSNSTLREVSLRENALHDYTGIVLSEAARENQNLQKCDVIRNPISFKYQEEIQKCLDVNIDLHRRSLMPSYVSTMEELRIFEKGKYDDYQRQEELNKHQREAQKQFNDKKYTLDKETKIEEAKTQEVFLQLEEIKQERKDLETFMANEEKEQTVELQDIEDENQKTSALIGTTNSDVTRMAVLKKERREFLSKTTVQLNEQSKNATAKLSQAINANRAQEQLVKSNSSLLLHQREKIEALMDKLYNLENKGDGNVTLRTGTDVVSKTDAQMQPEVTQKAAQKKKQQQSQSTIPAKTEQKGQPNKQQAQANKSQSQTNKQTGQMNNNNKSKSPPKNKK